MKEKKMRLIPIVIFVLLAFFLWRGLSRDTKLPSMQIGKPLPSFVLPTLDNKGTFTPKNMYGNVAILNVWGSWCSTCNLEQPFLMKLSEAGLKVYGLNYKDDPEKATAWLKTYGNPYVMVGQDSDGTVAIDLGVYGAPETFLLDKNGVVVYRHIGVLDEENWKTEFQSRIKKM